MVLLEEKASFKVEYNGQTYYFCGLGCKERFEKAPEEYLNGEIDWVKGE